MGVFNTGHPWELAFGILGNAISICVFLAPLPTFIRIIKEKSTMGFQSVPYVVALFSAMLWMYYALLKNAILLISINSLGCLIETIYVAIFIFYAPKECKKQTIKLVSMLNIGAFSGVFLVAQFALHQAPLRIIVVGWICVAFSMAVFVAPLSIVFQVVRTRSAEFMPFGLSCSLTISAVTWFLYGLLARDICVAIPNVVGFFLGCAQVVLYLIYRKPKPIVAEEVSKTKLPTPLPISLPGEHVINIVMIGNPEQVHPIENFHVGCEDADKDEKSNNNNNISMEILGEKKDDRDLDDDDKGGVDQRPCNVPAQVNIVHLDCSPALVACPA
ncbi:OLC1v1021305C1 [Oldenlandia corymbosa var. corymbosa]|uniref:Bidirectional sugar transporter SWEET n=1 Tax=Oldenlandia corymbosa var. corymbosa TaxID=529605 RepID=A0AAV1BVC7_OLDCO|nr:OLC1v1021305C1 [Oldenlandia corymbosa var. corymbosa]